MKNKDWELWEDDMGRLRDERFTVLHCTGAGVFWGVKDTKYGGHEL